MNYSIIGSGHVGKALAQRFARSGVPVTIANTRGPESLATLALELGPAVIAGSLQDALAADIIILAVPFAAHQEVARAIADWRGKHVIDAMNFREPSLAPLGGLQSSDFVAQALPGAKVVKTFNQLPAALLASDPHESGGRRVMFVAGNHDDANSEVASLVGSLGFAAITLGRIDEGGNLLRFRGPLVLHNFIKLGN
jgi:8-hydroxy-5-deazaflavin:NADPH oxidoreductase